MLVEMQSVTCRYAEQATEAASEVEHKRKATAVEVRRDMEEQLQQRRHLQQLARVLLLITWLPLASYSVQKASKVEISCWKPVTQLPNPALHRGSTRLSVRRWTRSCARSTRRTRLTPPNAPRSRRRRGTTSLTSSGSRRVTRDSPSRRIRRLCSTRPFSTDKNDT